jgi:hypothetical protein
MGEQCMTGVVLCCKERMLIHRQNRAGNFCLIMLRRLRTTIPKRFRPVAITRIPSAKVFPTDTVHEFDS